MVAPNLDAFVRDYHQALDEFFRGNPEPAKTLYSHREDVTLANPFEPVAVGWANVDETMTRAASNYRDGRATGFETIATWVTCELAYLVEVERFEAKVGGADEIASGALRVTSVLRSEGDAWKIVHRHADPITTRQAASRWFSARYAPWRFDGDSGHPSDSDPDSRAIRIGCPSPDGQEPHLLSVRSAVRGSPGSRGRAGAERLLGLRCLRVRGGGGTLSSGDRHDPTVRVPPAACELLARELRREPNAHVCARCRPRRCHAKPARRSRSSLSRTESTTSARRSKVTSSVVVAADPTNAQLKADCSKRPCR
jgi:ketosteroid isomerase-like protein